MKQTCSFVDKSGQQIEVALRPEHYLEAQKAGLTLRQYVNRKYPTKAGMPDTFSQLCESVDMYIKPVTELGIKPLTMQEIAYGGLDVSVASQGLEVSPVQTRVLFPAVIAELIENKMAVDRGSATAALNQMMAVTNTVSGRRVEQPVLDYTRPGGPESARVQARAQGAEPNVMLTLRASEKALTIPETPIAVTITDEAMQNVTIDMLSLTLARQVEVEGYTRVGEDLLKVLQGDPDAGGYGTSALASVKANSFDSTIVTAGTLSHKAYVFWLYSGLQYRRINYIVTDMAGAWAIDTRTGRPTFNDDNSMDRIDTKASIFYPALVDNVQVFVVPEGMGWPVNTLMGFDSSYALQRWINSQSTYSDVERYILRRAQSVVVSFGSKVTRFQDQAFNVLSLTL